MDAKKVAELDPKLKEVYDRVMGTSVPATTTPTMSTQTAPTASKPVLPTPSASTSQQPIAANPQQPASQPAFQPVTTTIITPSRHSSTSPLILLIVGILFFIGYVVFWVKFFGISLPFALPF